MTSETSITNLSPKEFTDLGYLERQRRFLDISTQSCEEVVSQSVNCYNGSKGKDESVSEFQSLSTLVSWKSPERSRTCVGPRTPVITVCVLEDLRVLIQS